MIICLVILSLIKGIVWEVFAVISELEDEDQADLEAEMLEEIQ